jgi:hypothetical protein
MMIIRLGIVRNKAIFTGGTLAVGKYNGYPIKLFLRGR